MGQSVEETFEFGVNIAIAEASRLGISGTLLPWIFERAIGGVDFKGYPTLDTVWKCIEIRQTSMTAV